MVSLPAAVAAATGGFLLGIATFILVRVLRRRAQRRCVSAAGGARQKVDVAGTLSFWSTSTS